MNRKWIVLIGSQLLSFLPVRAELIAQWDFENSLTNSVNPAYDAMWTGSGRPQYSSDAKSGSMSLCFRNLGGKENAADMVTVKAGGDWAGVSSWTFSAWVKPTALEAIQTIFSARGKSGIYTLYSQLRGATINTYYKLDDGTATGTGAVPWGGAEGQWFRVTVVFDAEARTVTEYRDSIDGIGGLVKLKTASNYGVPLTLSNFQIGFVDHFFGFQGCVDDVRIYNTALSEDEVDAISSGN